MIWSHDTGQQIPCFDSCQSQQMYNVKSVPMVMVLGLVYGHRYGCTFGQSHDN